jgi:hypothetical protein
LIALGQAIASPKWYGVEEAILGLQRIAEIPADQRIDGAAHGPVNPDPGQNYRNPL